MHCPERNMIAYLMQIGTLVVDYCFHREKLESIYSPYNKLCESVYVDEVQLFCHTLDN